MSDKPITKKKTKSSQYYTIKMGLHKNERVYILTKPIPKDGFVLVEMSDKSTLDIHISLLKS